MLRHYVSAAWRQARRDPLHALVNVIGLAIGLATAMLIGLYLRHELSYDTFLKDGDQVYRVSTQITLPGRGMSWTSGPPEHTAAALSIDFPELAGVARVTPARVGLRHDRVEASEVIFWADPSFLTVMGLPVVAGDAATALAAPDGIVLTQKAAKKYFGTAPALGATLELNRSVPMRVTAIIADLPTTTHLATEIIASGRAAQSSLRREDSEPQRVGATSFGGYLYVRLKPGIAAASLAPRLAEFALKHFPAGEAGADATRSMLVFKLDPMAEIHLLPYSSDMKEGGNPETLAAIALIGILVVLIASINFVNLMTARAARRAKEVGLRKAMGAMRRQLIGQFLGEALIFALLGGVIAVLIVDAALPRFNAIVDREIGGSVVQDPVLALALIGLVLLTGLAAGFYPALVLSSFRPAAVLHTARAGASGGGRLRQSLVILQFAISIGLAVATLVIIQQSDFAMGRALRLDTDQVVVIRGKQSCADGFRQPVRALGGVTDAVCSRAAPLDFSVNASTSTLPSGLQVDVNMINIDFGFFDFYGLQPVAGRFFDRDRATDQVRPGADAPVASIVINEAALRAFGDADAAAALDQDIAIEGPDGANLHYRIIGIVPDFPIGTIREAVQPSVFFVDPSDWGLLSVKLDGRQMPETLAAIDRLWSEQSVEAPIRRMFLDSEIARLYRDVTREREIFSAFALIAILIACLGLYSLSAFAAERRTQEIGIRKALGASTAQIVRLLIWQFVRPVLIANAIAWPLAFWLMRRWLDGFFYRVDLSWLPFALAGGAALLIAIGTTGFHAIQVARARPVTALRCE
jgi:putative ABC transport system permease protein